MTCAEFEVLLDRPEADEQAQAELKRHAQTCEHCRLLLELRGLDRDETVPVAAAARWRAALRTEQARVQQQHKPRHWLRYAAPVGAAAAVLIAVVALRQPIVDTADKALENAAAPKALTVSAPLPTAALTVTEGSAVPASGFSVLELPAMEADSAANESADASVYTEEEILADEAVPMAAAFYSVPAEETAGAMAETDEAEEIALEENAAPLTLVCRAADPARAAQAVLTAVGQANALPRSEDNDSGQLEFTLELDGEKWESLLPVLRDNGLIRDDLPAAPDGKMTIRLIIQPEEEGK